MVTTYGNFSQNFNEPNSVRNKNNTQSNGGYQDSFFDIYTSKIEQEQAKIRSLSPNKSILMGGEYKVNEIPHVLEQLKKLEKKKKTPIKKHRYSKAALKMYRDIKNLSKKDYLIK